MSLDNLRKKIYFRHTSYTNQFNDIKTCLDLPLDTQVVIKKQNNKKMLLQILE